VDSVTTTTVCDSYSGCGPPATHVGPWITFHGVFGLGWFGDGVCYLFEVLAWLIAISLVLTFVVWVLGMLGTVLVSVAMVFMFVGALLGRMFLPEPYRSRCGHALHVGIRTATRPANKPTPRRRRRFIFFFFRSH
jgi:hypothetical protein